QSSRHGQCQDVLCFHGMCNNHDPCGSTEKIALCAFTADVPSAHLGGRTTDTTLPVSGSREARSFRSWRTPTGQTRSKIGCGILGSGKSALGRGQAINCVPLRGGNQQSSSGVALFSDKEQNSVLRSAVFITKSREAP